jgi:glycosyltransferase involved in cell wall biosynthesis
VDFTAVHFLQPLMEGCRAAGWDVEFACAPGPGVSRLQDAGFRFRPFKVSRRLSPGANARALLSLTAALWDDPPTLVHTHTPIAGLIGRFAARLAGCRRIVHTFHGLPFGGSSSGFGPGVYLGLERLAARTTTSFFSQSQGDAARAVELGIARGKDMLVIGNGVDLSRFRPNEVIRAEVRGELGIPTNDLVVLFVGRLVREKGILDLADAARIADVPGLVYLIVGDALPSDRDPVTSELGRHPAALAGGGRWRQLGYRSDVERLLSCADMFVLPSYREGLPRSVIEALAGGVPVVASDIPACRELVEPGETGLLVPVGDPAALAAAIGELAGDPARRAAMGAAARRQAETRHDERMVIRMQLEAFEHIL